MTARYVEDAFSRRRFDERNGGVSRAPDWEAQVADASTVGRLGGGDHACLTFSDGEERLDLVAAFVRSGLQHGQRVVCWTDSIPPDEMARALADRSVRHGAATRRGQLSIAPVQTALLDGGGASVKEMISVLTTEVDRAARDGYTGVRITADMCWAARPLAAAGQLVAFETAAADLFADGRLCLICQYDRDRFDAVTLAFAAESHPKAVAAQVYYESPLLRICRQYSPAGVRVAGELDYRQQEEFEHALSESLRLDRHMYVNLRDLTYIDAACAALLVQAALRLAPSRRMSIVCRDLVATVLDLVGANTAPRMRVTTVHGHA
jgi:anti-anti-sigma factor